MILAFGLSFFLLICLFYFSWYVGGYMVSVMEGTFPIRGIYRLLRPIERLFDRFLSKISSFEMSYKEYLVALLSFHLVSIFFLYLFLRLQQPLISLLFHDVGPIVEPGVAFNMAISFVTNSDWQSVSPEKTLHPFSQVFLLLPQMFLSPAVGLSVFFATLRGLASENGQVGNFFKDMIRTIAYILLPIAFVGALILGFLGTEQELTQRPLALFESIKMIGTNGGGYFMQNSADMRENPNSWTTLFQWGYMLLLPMAAFRVFSEKMGNKLYGLRVGFLFCLVLSLLVAFMEYSEAVTPSFLSLDQSAQALHGKEVRVGSFFSSLWTVATTGTSCGATICDMALLKPLSKIIPLSLMHTGETLFGGVGVGAISVIFMQIVSMFSAGLLVGRTPDLFGKKIDSGTMKLALLAVMLPVFLIYIALWFQISFGGHELPSNPENAMTSLIYSMTSTTVSNGSGLSGMDYSLPCISSVHSFLMLMGRMLILSLALLLGEHLRSSKIHPRSEGSIHIESWTSVLWLGFFAVSSSLLFFCALWIIGPVMEFYLRQVG